MIHVNKPALRSHDDETINLLSGKHDQSGSGPPNPERSLNAERSSSPSLESNNGVSSNVQFKDYQLRGVGTWDRDESGKSLTPFIVLVVFLLFSTLVVSYYNEREGESERYHWTLLGYSGRLMAIGKKANHWCLRGCCRTR